MNDKREVKRSDGSSRTAGDIFVRFAKVDDERRLVYGIVYSPEEVDAQGDFAGAEEIEKGAHSFALNGAKMLHEHSEERPIACVETYLAPCDFELKPGDQQSKVKRGSWVLVSKVFDDALWADVKSGELTGYSMSGFASAGSRAEPDKAA